MAYQPRPVDTSGVKLTESLLELTELLAQNIHEVWAAQRLSEGWTYGPERDDEAKRHPCLVPYDELPESEKEYDRNTALETLRVITALGYRIERVDKPPPVDATSSGDSIIGEALRYGSNMTLPALLSLWRMQRATGHALPLEAHQKLGECVLRRGAPLVAYDVFAEGLARWPADVRLRQLMALALARSGATQRANDILTALAAEGHSDEETLGILARTHKDLAEQASDETERKRQLRLACEGYERAYRATRGYWTGINAATMATLLGDREKGRTLAHEVREQCLQELETTAHTQGDAYWLFATLGEAALILGEYTQAQDWYAKAAAAGSGRYGDLSSTRRNARLLLRYLTGDTSAIERLLPVPRIAVLARSFSQSTDLFDRPPSREAQDLMRQVIRQRLSERGVLIGYASVESLTGILFLEALLQMDGELHIVLPYDKEEFVADTLRAETASDYSDRLERLISSAVEVVTASQSKLQETRVAGEYADLILQGLSSLRATQLETELVPVAFCDSSLKGMGAAARIAAEWRERGYQAEIIDLPYPHEAVTSNSVSGTQLSDAHEDICLASEIMAIMFADTVSFSRLSDGDVRRFVEHFLGGIAELVVRMTEAPVALNTWGDGLFAIFRSVTSAGCFALELTELISQTDWAAKGLPSDLSVRIALHAGPVWPYTNPVTGKSDYIGTHVTRAARLEPATPPGHVYATYGFASIAAVERVREFTCEYVGETPLAKAAGMCPTYHVRRRKAETSGAGCQ